ncbi:hypothetical protein VTK73DRAFT_8012 [Phialemonium thermophilum]|uniref:Uncharacterized protein n=1 Tax=Phialemonium thermophilum TaxID=223376 RepID=A0ABR3XQ59_9PEZI
MADEIPPSLRQADINVYKCAVKAAQLQTVKPIVAYWCEYWVVNQVLAKQLHATDEQILAYTTHLMDKLEQTKTEYANEDAITDDVAGQAYIEQFAQETLDRAERAVRANKVTQQTATTFDAAATFFQLVNIWGPPDQETQQKIKYAKWNTARIAKAIKEGKDPNESNPRHEAVAQPDLDPHDPEAQLLNPSPSANAPRPATVEDAPESDSVKEAAGVSLPFSPASASRPTSSDGLRLPGVPTEIGHKPQPQPQPGYFDESPIAPPQSSSEDISSPPAAEAAVPSPDRWSHPDPATPPVSTLPGSPPHLESARQPPSTTPASQPTFAASPRPAPAVAPAPGPTIPRADSYYTNVPSSSHTNPIHRPAAAPLPRPTSNASSYATYKPAPPAANPNVDEEAMVLAQKHAKWAVSALNFEDVPTAVRELRKALEALGAS